MAGTIVIGREKGGQGEKKAKEPLPTRAYWTVVPLRSPRKSLEKAGWAGKRHQDPLALEASSEPKLKKGRIGG